MPRDIGEGTPCPMPSIVRLGDEPLQTDVPVGMPYFELPKITLRPLAGFSIDARVLLRKDYEGTDNASRLSRTDLALGWKMMTKDDVLAQIKMSQGTRRLHWQTDNPSIRFDDMTVNATNAHLIPSSRDVAEKINQIRKDDHIRIDGWLVEVYDIKAKTVIWRSSTSRTDTGDGACELIYVCNVEHFPPY